MGCGGEGYCSADCQRKAWPAHKLKCQKKDNAENDIRELLGERRLYSARERLRQLPKAIAKLEGELEELISFGIYSEIINGAMSQECVGEMGQGYVSARDLSPDEPLLFDTAFLTATGDGDKAPHFLMGEKMAKRLAGGARRKSAKADAQADFFFSRVKAELPLKGNMDRSAILDAAMEPEMQEQMLICSIVEGCALYCTEEPNHMSLFPAAVYFNHSCAPNARIESTRSTLIVRASREIRRGEEVFISYLPPVLLEVAGSKRRERLEGGRGFDCICTRCRDEPRAEDQNVVPQVAPVVPITPEAPEEVD